MGAGTEETGGRKLQTSTRNGVVPHEGRTEIPNTQIPGELGHGNTIRHLVKSHERDHRHSEYSTSPTGDCSFNTFHKILPWKTKEKQWLSLCGFLHK